SDRIEEQGIVAFVTNGGWLDGNTAAGVRKSFEDEFSAVYVYDLRGNQRMTGDLRLRQGGVIFEATGGSGGSRAPISIMVLVNEPTHKGPAKIHYHDIGEYLSTRDKLDLIHEAGSYQNLEWEEVKIGR